MDGSWALRALGGRPVEDWEQLLAAEQRRRRPRVRLVSTLQLRIDAHYGRLAAGELARYPANMPAQNVHATDARPDDDAPTTAVVNTTKGVKRLWMQAHKKAASSWNEWAARVLTAAAKKELDGR